MTFLDLFSGIGAFALGLTRAGLTPAAFVEIDPFCRDVLRRHWPDVPILHDVRTAEFPHADVICGGFPCTDVSRAGKRAGITGANSGLYRELVRAFRLVRPKFALVENVAALLGDGMGDVLGDLAEGGNCVEWDCVPANAIGACHERDRVWIVAHTSRHGCGSRRAWRPPDSFAWVRDAARWNAGHTYRARLAQWKDAAPPRPHTESERAAIADVWQQEWPCEPALLGVDHGIADRMDRTRAIGNSLIPQIPELIALAILDHQ